MITSTQNPRVKLLRLLQAQARARRKEGLIVLEGQRLIQDALGQGQIPSFVFHTERSLLPTSLLHAEQVSPEIMRHVSVTQQPQGIIAAFPMPQPELPPLPGHVLILDAIRDPGNLGTILRAAAASGTEVVLLAGDCVDLYNPKVLRAGMGAHFRLAATPLTWDAIRDYCAGLAVYLADSSGDLDYGQVDWTVGWALIIGSEAHGAGREAQALAQQRISIPMAAGSESINAAMAAAVILFEAQRQRLTQG
jgi:TrmH family RNA methyltransferase